MYRTVIFISGCHKNDRYISSPDMASAKWIKTATLEFIKNRRIATQFYLTGELRYNREDCYTLLLEK